MTHVVHQPSPGPGRPADKREAIIASLLELLVSGQLKPGERVPAQAQLRRRFRASPGTVQGAMDQMTRDGHIVAKGNAGTFVAPRPPHLHRFGLVFLQTPDQMPFWSHFYRAMIQVAPAVAAARSCEVDTYYMHNLDPRLPDCTRLISDLTRRRLAGIIVTMNPGDDVDSPLLRLTRTPRVVIASSHQYKGISSLHVDHGRFIENAMAYLRDSGHRRIAIFDFLGKGCLDHASALSRHSLTTRPHWHFRAEPHMHDAIRHYVQTLLEHPKDRRPDALLVTDDNLTAAVSQGVAASGLSAPGEIQIVSHANWPSLPTVATPVTWIGFDANDLIGRCLDALQAQAGGEGYPALSLVPPLPLLATDATVTGNSSIKRVATVMKR